MATLVLTNAFVSIDGNNVSDHVRSVSLDYAADMIEDTNMGDDTHIMLGGLKTWSMSIEFAQDFAASNLDSILFPLVGTTFTVIARPDAGSVSTSNPNYTGTGILASTPPFGNGVGELATASVDIQSAGTLSRATS